MDVVIKGTGFDSTIDSVYLKTTTREQLDIDYSFLTKEQRGEIWKQSEPIRAVKKSSAVAEPSPVDGGGN